MLFRSVWAYQGWNMAFNISVKFKENAPGIYTDRWRWVRDGMELLRDNGLRYNPDDILIYRELAWLFQFKMGDVLDDANRYYKQQWAEEMTPFFGPAGTNIVDLLQPGNTNAVVLEQKYKMQPAFIEKVNEQYGPLDWRLPEPSALYWASAGLQKAKDHPDKVQQDDLMMLRRVIFQSMQQEFRHGRIISNPFTHGVEVTPNLDIISKVNDAYVKMMADSDAGDSNHIHSAGYKNFLRDAVYFLYENDRVTDAAKWFKYYGEKYPTAQMLDSDTNSLQKNITLDDYAIGRVQEDIGDTSQERVTEAVQGTLWRSYLNLALGQNDYYAGNQLLAQRIYERYQMKMGHAEQRVTLPPMKNVQLAP